MNWRHVYDPDKMPVWWFITSMIAVAILIATIIICAAVICGVSLTRV